MNRILYSLALTLALGFLGFKGVQAQKSGKGSKLGTTTTVPPEKTPYTIPFLNVAEPPTHQHYHNGHVDKSVQQNSSLPFSVRFPAPERKSSRFHYPMLPSVYWSLHERPKVPLVEPEQELGYGFDYD